MRGASKASSKESDAATKGSDSTTTTAPTTATFRTATTPSRRSAATATSAANTAPWKAATAPDDAPTAVPARVLKDIATDFSDGAIEDSFYSTGVFTVLSETSVCDDGEEWEERVSVENRCKFYVNKRRGLKQWAMPLGFAPERVARRNQELADSCAVEVTRVREQYALDAVKRKEAEVEAKRAAAAMPKPVGPMQRPLLSQYTRIDAMTCVKTLTDPGHYPQLCTIAMTKNTGVWYFEFEIMAFCVPRCRGIVVGVCHRTVAQWDTNVARGPHGRGYKISTGEVIFGDDERSVVVDVRNILFVV